MDKRPIQLPDPLKHFAKHNAVVKLIALAFVRTPFLFIGYVLGKWPGWWL